MCSSVRDSDQFRRDTNYERVKRVRRWQRVEFTAPRQFHATIGYRHAGRLGAPSGQAGTYLLASGCVQ
eukprot:633931-Prymnesium_polylepis.1